MTISRGGVIVVSDVRFRPDSSGRLRAGHSAGAYDAWRPYLEAFGAITVMARCEAGCADQGLVAEGPGVCFARMPDYSGFRGLFLRLPSLVRAMMAVGGRDSLFVGRLPEPLAVLAYARSRVSRSRYVAHVVAEPRGLGVAYWPGPVGTVIGVLLSWAVRHIAARSDGVLYVTEWALQTMYPSRPGVPTLSRSDAGLVADDFRVRPLRQDAAPSPIRLVGVGGLQGPVKGHDTLIRVVRLPHDRGVPAHLTIIGGGKSAGRLIELASELGVEGSVCLTGQVHHREDMRALLDEADIYVSGSRSEGLPRATLEAMARSLPVVATDVGGLHEIVPGPYLVPVDAAEEMTALVGRLAVSPAERHAAGSANRARARKSTGTASDELFVAFHEQFSPSRLSGRGGDGLGPAIRRRIVSR